MLYEFKFTDRTYYDAISYLNGNFVEYDADEMRNKVWIYADPVDFESHTYPTLAELAHSVRVHHENCA